MVRLRNIYLHLIALWDILSIMFNGEYAAWRQNEESDDVPSEEELDKEVEEDNNLENTDNNNNEE